MHLSHGRNYSSTQIRAMDPSVLILWRDNINSLTPGRHQQKMPANVFAFGDSGELADRLAMLLREGVKTATCSALRTYEEGQKPLCLEEEIILSFSMETVFPSRLLKLFTCLSRPSTRSLSRSPTDEGEGDRSPACWRQTHRNYFSRQRFKNRTFDGYFPSR